MARSALIVGAGITGVSTAIWMLRDGWRVTLVDPVEPGSSGQTSFGNAGLIARTSMIPVATPSMVLKAPLMVFDPHSPLFLRWSYLPRLLPWLLPFMRNATEARMREVVPHLSMLIFDASEQHLAVSQGTAAEKHIAKGDYITLYNRQSDYEDDTLTIELRRQFGLEPVSLTRKELLERDPNLGPSYTFGTMFSDFHWLTSPAKYVAALFEHACREGAVFKPGSVVALAAGETPSVTLQGGETLSADKVVLTAGAWSGKLAGTMGKATKVEAERGYHVSMYAPNFTAPVPYMVTDAKCVVTPMDGFLRAAGVAEFAGLDAPAAKAPIRMIEAAVKRVYPNLTFERSEPWMGRRPTMPDSLPAVGEIDGAPNVIHAYGGQHVGLTIGPKLGRWVTDLANRRPVNVDLSAFKPDRF
ncbi:MAG: FAD-binding oxidoreductase [Tepidamorphaceae bacterium]